MVLLHNLKNIFYVPELRKKLVFTLGVLAVFRFGVHVPVPGVDLIALGNLLHSRFAGGGFLSYLDLFSGGALRNFAIFALGISPYITASIMMQLFTIMMPSFEALAKEGEYGRKIINQYTRYLTVIISIVQSFGFAAWMEHAAPGIVVSPGWGFRLSATLILTLGSLFVMWLGEQINAHGLGNGSSMIIFAGIVARLPEAIFKILESYRMEQCDPLIIGLLGLVSMAFIAFIVFLERGERKIPVQYAKRVVGQRVFGGQSSYIPLKLNPAGVVPVIFASSILGFPLTIASIFAARWPEIGQFLTEWLRYGPLYYTLECGLIIFFAFFYTAIIFNPVELADNIRKSGGFIPGIRPGRKTAEFFDYLLTRVGFPGAVYLATLAVLPAILQAFISFPTMFSGVSLLIVVGVALDSTAQIESHLIERRYEGFLSTGRLKGRYSNR